MCIVLVYCRCFSFSFESARAPACIISLNLIKASCCLSHSPPPPLCLSFCLSFLSVFAGLFGKGRDNWIIIWIRLWSGFLRVNASLTESSRDFFFPALTARFSDFKRFILFEYWFVSDSNESDNFIMSGSETTNESKLEAVIQVLFIYLFNFINYYRLFGRIAYYIPYLWVALDKINYITNKCKWNVFAGLVQSVPVTPQVCVLIWSKYTAGHHWDHLLLTHTHSHCGIIALCVCVSEVGGERSVRRKAADGSRIFSRWTRVQFTGPRARDRLQKPERQRWDSRHSSSVLRTFPLRYKNVISELTF